MPRAKPTDPSPATLRRAIADWMVRDEGVSPPTLVEAHGVEAVLGAIEHEGVVSLLHARLSEMATVGPVPPELQQALATRARLSAGRSLLCVSEARRIQKALADAGISAIWLKGVALGQWLYPSAHLRDIADIDLLLPDHATTMRAAKVLAPLGYALPNAHIAGDLVVHELLAYSERTRLELDLHWDVSNSALFAGCLPWPVLASEAFSVAGLGNGACGLSPVHALLHASMHLATGKLVWREDRLRWLYDIHVLAQSFDAETWSRVLGAAQVARLADPCVYALRACKRVFGTLVDADVLSDLEAAAGSERVRSAQLGRWGYFQWACWQRLPDLRTRVQWLRQLLFPDMAHLRERYGADGAGMLAIALRRLGDGYARWWAYVKRYQH